jgi:hypothetical protein
VLVSELDGVGLILDGEVSDNLVVIAVTLDGGADEGDLGVLLCVKEIRALEMSIPVGATSVDARRVDLEACLGGAYV